jgi:hypothetical protein
LNSLLFSYRNDAPLLIHAWCVKAEALVGGASCSAECLVFFRCANLAQAARNFHLMAHASWLKQVIKYQQLINTLADVSFLSNQGKFILLIKELVLVNDHWS